METKTCNSCQETKTIDQFYKSNSQYLKFGVDYYCKYCRNGNSLKSHRGGNKKGCSVEGCKKSHYAKTWCRMHYARVERNGKIEPKNKNQKDLDRKAYNLRVKYLMTLEEFNLRSINGCELCGDKPERTLHVDHDHKCCNVEITCGKCVRGVLCNRCNKAVDKYERGIMRPDNPLLNKISQYVVTYNTKRYDETNKHNAIIADNLEEFIAKLDGGNKNG
jgi:hypothetical protein